MKKLFWLILLLLLSSAAFGTNAVYIGQAAAGANDGTSCANQKAISYFNTGGNWSATPTGIQIGPDTSVYLCGTITTALAVQGSGTSGHPVTVSPAPATTATINASGLTGAIIHFEGQQWITVDGINGDAQGGNTTYTLRIINIASTSGVNTYCGYENNGGGNITIQHVECAGNGSAEPDDNGGGFYLNGAAVGGMHTKFNWIHSSVNPTKWQGTGSTMFCATGTSSFTDCTQEHNKVEYMLNDGLRCSSNCTLDSNEVDHIDGSGHSDSLLCQSGSYCSVANNYVHDSGDQNIYLDNLYDGICHHIRVYNNVIASDPGFGIVLDPEGAAGSPPALTGCTVGTSTWDDVVIANNTVGKTSAASIRTSGRGALTNVVVENNIFGTNSDNSYHAINWTTGTSVTFASSTAWNYDVYSTSGVTYPILAAFNGANDTLAQLQALSPAREVNGKVGIPAYVNSGVNDFHLQSGDTVARGAGLNLTSTYSFLTSDKDGAARPASAAWALGAYQSSSGSVQPPTNVTATVH